MKLTARRLRRLIKETINEADGTSGTRGGVSVPGVSDRYSQNTWFPNTEPNQGITRVDDDSSEVGGGLDSADSFGYGGAQSQQGMDQDVEGLEGESGPSEKSYSESDFKYVIDSQVTRGKAGNILHSASGKSFSVTEGSTMADALKKYHNKAAGRQSIKARCTDVLEVMIKERLMSSPNSKGANDKAEKIKLDIQWLNELIKKDLDQIKEFKAVGIKGVNTGKLYPLGEYFEKYLLQRNMPGSIDAMNENRARRARYRRKFR
jgi:hypothetical protein